MIAAPSPTGPALGPLPAPGEPELERAFPRLRDEALTLSWAAEMLGTSVARLEALARTGRLLVVPGPWRMRQTYRSGLGYLVPAWQLDGTGLRAGIPSLIRAAHGLTSLQLHEFMTSAMRPGEETPAQLLAATGVEPVLALLRGDAAPAPAGPARDPSRRGPRRRHAVLRGPQSRRRTVAR